MEMEEISAHPCTASAKSAYPCTALTGYNVSIPVTLPESGRVWVTRPLNNVAYSKHECLDIIKSKTVKGSKDRAAMIQFMLDCKFVPHRTGLYKLLHRYEHGLAIGDDNWAEEANTPGEEQISSTKADPIPIHHSEQYISKVHVPSLPPQSKKPRKLSKVHVPGGEYVRFDLRDKLAWKGRLRLVVIPIRFSDYYHMEYDWKHPISTVCAKTANLQQAIDICDYIGNSDIFAGTTYRHVNQHNRVNRLYFSVSEFKPSQMRTCKRKISIV